MEWMRLVKPAVSAVRQPVEEMADCAWKLLVRRIAGDTTAPQSRRLNCAVTLRASTPPRAGGGILQETTITTSNGG